MVSTAESQRPAILVVEDDTGVRDMLCMLFAGEGYAAVAACDGRDALRQVEAGLVPALVTLDLRMPVLDGWGFLAAYRRRPRPHAPVLIITALAQNGHTISRDVAGVITKPFALDELLARVQELAPLPL